MNSINNNFNILIISAVFTPEPVVSAKLSEDIANDLSGRYNVSVIAPEPTRPLGFNFEKKIKKNVNYELINLKSYTCPQSSILGRLRESLNFGLACKKYIDNNFESIDVIYMNSWPMFSQFLILKAARKHKIRVITHVQDIYPESLSNKVPKLKSILNFIFLPIDRIILNSSYKVVAISNKMKEYLSKTRDINPNKFLVVKNWQNEESFTSLIKESKKKEDKFIFMYLGNIGPVAGVDLIINAFGNAHLSNCKLIIAGSGSKKNDLQKMVKKAGFEDVIFIDVPDGKVPETQDMADVMLLPIKKGAASSSIPSKLPAYMFSKKPILASVDINSDTARVVLESNCGWVIEPENEGLLKNKMIEICHLNNKELEKKGSEGFNYAIKHLSKKSNLKKITNIIIDSLN